MSAYKLVFFVLFYFTINSTGLLAQNIKSNHGLIGFYNLENLFDTIDAPDINDEEFTPKGAKLWNTAKYYDKLENMSSVISQIGTNLNPDGLAVLGVCEIENRRVLEDLVSQSKLKNRNYHIVHFDSYDSRGIDLALIYSPKYFSPIQAKPVPVKIYDGTKQIFTRDILVVSGLLLGEPVTFMVNHWPSRRGGESLTNPWRISAASECRKIVDSLLTINPESRIVVMGDLNDEPTSPSVKNYIKTSGNLKKLKQGEMYNTMEQFYVRGIGTLAYKDAWGLFDQIIISDGWIRDSKKGLVFEKSYIFNKEFLLQKTGKYKGYPLRTFNGNEYAYGFSDHLPVFISFIKKVN
jgi:hypothetical protein